MGAEMSKNPWLRFGVNAWYLGLEASFVIALRMLKIAAGEVAAEVEARRMVSERSKPAWLYRRLR